MSVGIAEANLLRCEVVGLKEQVRELRESAKYTQQHAREMEERLATLVSTAQLEAALSTKISQSAASLLVERAKEALVKLVNEKAEEKEVDLLQKSTRDNALHKSLVLDIKKQCQNLDEKILERFQMFEKEVDERIDREMKIFLMSHRVSSQNKEDTSYSLKHTVAQMDAKLMKLQQHLREDKQQHEISMHKIAEWMAVVDSQLHKKEAEPKCITGSKKEATGRKLPSTQEPESLEMDDKHQSKLGDRTRIANPQRDRKEVALVQRENIKGSDIPASEGESSSRTGLKSAGSERNRQYKSYDHRIMRTTTTQTDTPVLDSGEKSKKAPREVEDIEALILSKYKLEVASFQERLAAELVANQQIVDAKLNTNQRVIEEKAVTMQRALEVKLRTHQETIEAKVLQFDKALKDATSEEKRFLKSRPIIVADTERDKHLDDQLRILKSRIKYLEDEIRDIKEPLATLITNLGEENAALMEEIHRTQHEFRQLLLQYKHVTEIQKPSLLQPPRPMSAKTGRSSASVRIKSASNVRRQETMSARSHCHTAQHDTISSIQGWAMDNKITRSDSTLNLIKSTELSQMSTERLIKSNLHSL